MTTSQIIALAASHLLILGLAYGVMRDLKPEIEPQVGETPRRTRSSDRSKVLSSGDGPELLVEFRQDFMRKKTRYEELKASLRPADDLKAAAIEGWGTQSSDQERNEVLAVMQARFYQWMRVNPREAMEYLAATLTGDEAMKRGELISIMALHVLPDVAREKGVIKSIDWLVMHPAGMRPLWMTLIAEMRNGGGLALFLRVEQALAGNSQPWSDIGAGSDGMAMLRQAGASVGFAEKEKLVDYLKIQTDEARATNLLLGFAGQGEATATWVLGLVDRGELPENVASRMRGGIGNEVLKQNGVEMEKRIAARRFTPGNEKKPRENILDELVSNDVSHYLNEGRDWRFEFRHGTASLDEILSSVDGALKIPDEGRDDARIALYRTLSEENPEKALPLLDTLPEERRREIMFSNT